MSSNQPHSTLTLGQELVHLRSKGGRPKVKKYLSLSQWMHPPTPCIWGCSWFLLPPNTHSRGGSLLVHSVQPTHP